ncbi:hypothetical protein [Bradyrhizobium sp. 1]|uniref:hypothetical protein n=1 Tax=Bradyrhizobium sp. 1 TaxID=241591 RepID=UPI001FF9121A|nr:hypothetical protein [Bradyrhizobium sp. 1]MCK1396049.1 hypothetical protein [Bradyrhizobium sp. 1]
MADHHRLINVPAWFAAILSVILIFHFAQFLDRAYPALVDDHDIIAPLGSSATAPAADVLEDLRQTDDFQSFATIGKAERFRPFHYPFKSLQIYLFGDNFRLWYIAAFAIYVATATMLFTLVYRRFGLVIGLLFSALYFGHPAWSDIMPRLGPVEIDCILIGTIAIYFCWRWITEGRPILLALAIVAALTYATTKEPSSVFLIAIGGLLATCGALLANRRMAIVGAVCIPCGAVVLLLLVKTTPTATDGIIPLTLPLKSYLRHWHHDRTAWITIALLVALAIAAIQKARNTLEVDGRELIAMLLATLSIEAMRFMIYYLTHAATYAGENDAISIRYGYPIFVVTSLVAAIVLGRLSHLPNRPAAQRTLRFAVACTIAMLLVNQGLLARKTLASRDSWQAFNTSTEQTIQAIANWLTTQRKAGQEPRLIVTGPLLEWEPRLSLIMFLRHRMPDTPVYFDPDEPSQKRAIYHRESIRYGGTPLPEPPDPASCLDVHVDTDPYQSKLCSASMAIIKPF